MTPLPTRFCLLHQHQPQSRRNHIALTMLLPALKSLRDCSDYSLTVEPFIPQLYALPARLLDVRSLEGLTQLYIETNPLLSAFAVSVFLGLGFLIVSEVNRNYSQVDRLWSILPNLYVAHLAIWARLAGLPHSRIDLVAAFTTAWSVRRPSKPRFIQDCANACPPSAG
jgi:hypothetical protein